MKKLSRRHFLKYAGAGTVLLAGTNPLSSWDGRLKASPTLRPTTDRVNFILINIDDLGWTDLTCYDSRYYETPNIDRLAAQGMKFTDGYAACAVCSPTRAALMTGRYPARVGVTDWIHHLDLAAHTAIGSRTNPTAYGGGPGRKLLCPPNPYWMELDEVTIAEILQAAGYTTCHIGKWHLGPQDWFPDKQGFDINIGGCEIGQPPTYFDPYYQNPQRSSIPTLPPREQGEYLTDREGDEAVKFITEHRDKPFFLNLCHYAVHTPLQAKDEITRKYETKPKTNQTKPVYAAMIESVDKAVGRVLAALEKLRLVDKTIVIFTSDNGGLKDYATDNAPLRSGKGYPYEGGIRVPLIVRWPGTVKAGSICRVPATSVDILPTICQAAGLNLPSERAIDGESLMPLLTQEGNLIRDALFWHFPHYRGDVVPYSIIRKGVWKLIKRYEGPTFELYNLNEDLSETQDLAQTLPDKVHALDKELVAWLEQTGAKLPRPNPSYRPPNK